MAKGKWIVLVNMRHRKVLQFELVQNAVGVCVYV